MRGKLESLIDPLARGSASKTADSRKLFGSAASIELLVPHEIHLDGDKLIYDNTAPKRRKAGIMDALSEFIKLDKRSLLDQTRAILEFAKEWGVFGICDEHGLPFSHAEFPGVSVFGSCCFPGTARFESREYWSEPLYFWWRNIPRIAAIYRIGVALATGHRGEERDWVTVIPEFLPAEEVRKQRNAGIEIDDRFKVPELPKPWEEQEMDRKNRIPPKRHACGILANEIQDMVGVASLRPRFFWDQKARRFSVEHGAPTGLWPLFGWLTLRLMTETCHAGEGFVYIICPYCQNEYASKRRPGSEQRHACPRKECQQARMRFYKQRQRKEN